MLDCCHLGATLFGQEASLLNDDETYLLGIDLNSVLLSISVRQ